MRTSQTAGATADEGVDPILDAAIVELMGTGTLRIPAYPAVALQIRELVTRGDYGVDQLGRLVASDQVVAAHTLRVANSPYYSRGTPAISLNQAIARVGGNELAQIALASRLGALAGEDGPLAPLRRRCWSDGLAGAFLSHALAPCRLVRPDEAFAAGLLHDFGRVVAVTCLEKIIASRPGARPRAVEEWEAVVDRYHVELGVLTAARWNLPAVLADSIALHHARSFEGASNPSLVELVATVDRITAMLADRAHVGEDDLAGVSLVKRGEVDAVLRAISAVGAFVSSFDASDGPDSAGEHLIATAAPEPVEVVAPRRVLLAYRGRAHPFRLVGLALHALVVAGPEMVPHDVILEMMIDGDVPIEGHARARQSWSAAGERRHLVRPYALIGPALEHWKDLVAASGLVAARA